MTAVMRGHMLGLGNNKEAFAMESFLTLVIAVGGIATGIGAIWAALADRRQGQISERQAQLTEQSLAQTDRSLAEQVQSLREQNERSRRQWAAPQNLANLLMRYPNGFGFYYSRSYRAAIVRGAVATFSA